MNARRCCAAGALIAALFALLAARADTVYRWVDKNGEVHYSQTPPPTSHVRAQAVDVEPAPPDLTGARQAEQLESAMQARNAAEQKAAAEAQQAAEKKAEQEKLCRTARERLQQLNAAHRVIQTKSNGEMQYYTGEDLVKLRQQAEQQVAKICGAGG